MNLLLGFVLFLLLCGGGLFLKWATLLVGEKMFKRPLMAELVSDLVAVVFMIGFSILTAPYMGLGHW